MASSILLDKPSGFVVSAGLLDLATTWAWIAWVACLYLHWDGESSKESAIEDTSSELDGRIDWLAARIATVILACIPASAASIPSADAVATRHQLATELGVRHLHPPARSLGYLVGFRGEGHLTKPSPAHIPVKTLQARCHLKTKERLV